MTLSDEIKQKKIKRYQKRIFFILRKLYSVFNGQAKYIQIVDQYQKVYRPLVDHVDPGPVNFFRSKGKRAIKKRRYDCFFALLNNIIAEFHTYCLDQMNEAALLEALIEAEEVLDKGIETYRVTGSEAEGFYLV